MSFESRAQKFNLEDGHSVIDASPDGEPRPSTRNYQGVKRALISGVLLGACLTVGVMYGIGQMPALVGTPEDKVGLLKTKLVLSCGIPAAAQVPSPDAGAGIFMGTATERASVEKEFNVIFSSDAGLWQENCYSLLAGAPRYHIATAIESSSEELNKKVRDISAAVLEYGNFGYPEYFVPKTSFDPAQPTGGLAPSHVYVVRGYIDRNTRIVENVYADRSPPRFALNTFLGATEREGGIEARLKYRLPGGFEFIVTVSPLV